MSLATTLPFQNVVSTVSGAHPVSWGNAGQLTSRAPVFDLRQHAIPVAPYRAQQQTQLQTRVNTVNASLGFEFNPSEFGVEIPADLPSAGTALGVIPAGDVAASVANTVTNPMTQGNIGTIVAAPLVSNPTSSTALAFGPDTQTNTLSLAKVNLPSFGTGSVAATALALAPTLPALNPSSSTALVVSPDNQPTTLSLTNFVLPGPGTVTATATALALPPTTAHLPRTDAVDATKAGNVASEELLQTSAVETKLPYKLGGDTDARNQTRVAATTQVLANISSGEVRAVDFVSTSLGQLFGGIMGAGESMIDSVTQALQSASGAGMSFFQSLVPDTTGERAPPIGPRAAPVESVPGPVHPALTPSQKGLASNFLQFTSGLASTGPPPKDIPLTNAIRILEETSAVDVLTHKPTYDKYVSALQTITNENYSSKPQIKYAEKVLDLIKDPFSNDEFLQARIRSNTPGAVKVKAVQPATRPQPIVSKMASLVEEYPGLAEFSDSTVRLAANLNSVNLSKAEVSDIRKEILSWNPPPALQRHVSAIRDAFIFNDADEQFKNAYVTELMTDPKTLDMFVKASYAFPPERQKEVYQKVIQTALGNSNNLLPVTTPQPGPRPTPPAPVAGTQTEIQVTGTHPYSPSLLESYDNYVFKNLNTNQQSGPLNRALVFREAAAPYSPSLPKSYDNYVFKNLYTNQQPGPLNRALVNYDKPLNQDNNAIAGMIGIVVLGALKLLFTRKKSESKREYSKRIEDVQRTVALPETLNAWIMSTSLHASCDVWILIMIALGASAGSIPALKILFAERAQRADKKVQQYLWGASLTAHASQVTDGETVRAIASIINDEFFVRVEEVETMNFTSTDISILTSKEAVNAVDKWALNIGLEIFTMFLHRESTLEKYYKELVNDSKKSEAKTKTAAKPETATSSVAIWESLKPLELVVLPSILEYMIDRILYQDRATERLHRRTAGIPFVHLADEPAFSEFTTVNGFVVQPAPAVLRYALREEGTGSTPARNVGEITEGVRNLLKRHSYDAPTLRYWLNGSLELKQREKVKAAAKGPVSTMSKKELAARLLSVRAETEVTEAVSVWKHSALEADLNAESILVSQLGYWELTLLAQNTDVTTVHDLDLLEAWIAKRRVEADQVQQALATKTALKLDFSGIHPAMSQ